MVGKSSAPWNLLNIWCKVQNQLMENNESKTRKKLDGQAPDQNGTGGPPAPRSLVDKLSSETSPFNSSIKSDF